MFSHPRLECQWYDYEGYVTDMTSLLSPGVPPGEDQASKPDAALTLDHHL